jgi:hypothetical protein
MISEFREFTLSRNLVIHDLCGITGDSRTFQVLADSLVQKTIDGAMLMTEQIPFTFGAPS